MKKKKTTKKKEGEYYVEVSVNDVVLKGSGDSFVAALTEVVNSPDFPYGAKTQVILNYAKGDTKKRRVMQTIIGRKMLNLIALKPTAVEVFAQKLEDSLLG